MAIWLSRLAFDRWRLCEGIGLGEGADGAPLALIADSAHGPRISATNDAGCAAGVRTGMLLADARSLCPALATAPSDPAGDLAFLEKLAIWAQRWGLWSALDPPDGLLVDVSGVAHLFGGEQHLLDDARDAFAVRGIAARLAIAPTAGAAWALAHYGPGQSIMGPGEGAGACLANLPVAALRLDAEVVIVLRRLGFKRVGDLATPGRDALQRRFRSRRAPSANPLIRLDQLLGRVPEPLLPVIARPMPLVQRRLLEPIRHRDLLDRVLADLADDMVRELEGRSEGARRLDLRLWRVDGEVVTRHLELSAATRDAAHVFRLLRARLEDVDAGFGIETVQLRASWSIPLGLKQDDIEATAEAHGTSLDACIDRLTTRLGSKAVRRPVAHASHVPERAQRWHAPLEPEAPSQGELAFHCRPLKLLDRAEPITVLYASPDGYPRTFRWRAKVRDVVRVEGPERIAPEWWREPSHARLRDYYRIEDSNGARYWIYRLGMIGDGRGGLPQWYLHGLFR